MALARTEDVMDLADALGTCADSMQANLMKRIRAGEIPPAEARDAFDVAVHLRQTANRLYLDAAERVVADLEEPQSDLLTTVETARKRMEGIRKIGLVMEMSSNMLALATAVHTRKPKLILAALKEMRSDLKRWDEAKEGAEEKGASSA